MILYLKNKHINLQYSKEEHSKTYVSRQTVYDKLKPNLLENALPI